ncbi:transposase [Sulfitobacter mediterraneus]|uniref:integrase core domain-containing protein n=1 Tax=Sulfitobacter mediterraneus TaxID=83219 RepID=UPI0019343572|nr:integrase core domain-containing protein [Sulfitobacter mediterraneus]MBM1312201.1 transposase [Sulfitobacter mediterraneus]MBM1316019.1 transposase [Sulfitobacter mediterraneus]MBM1324442.1 transposase [Sulfitobacter mediterraneus]MBM1328300.1 transposase [Sulfitobacter mediterraneus]MBM1399671.1 transposase [Sulfitobacter mediterraneus]
MTEANVKILKDGRGRYLEDIFVELQWRSLKQEAVHLYELQDGFKAERVIKNWIRFYNSERPHIASDKRTPDDAFFGADRTRKAA